MRHRFAIFGTGSMASIYAELLFQRADVDLIGVVGNTPETTEKFGSQFGIEAYPHSQFEEMLKEHPDVDAVIIATPEWVREAPIAAAVDSGLNILLEKPFADSWDDCIRYSGLLKNFRGVFDTCHVLRHSPRFFALRNAVADGKIGDVRHIGSRRNSNKVRVRRVLGRTDLSFWLASHDIDIIRWITGSDVEEVYALSREGLSSADDYLIANIRLATGVDAVLEVSWCGPPVSPTARHAVFEVCGTKGHIELDDSDMNVRIFNENDTVDSPDTYEHFDLQGRKSGYFRNMIDKFVRDLDDNRDSTQSLSDAVEATRACAMIRKSLDEHRTVHRTEFR